MALTNTPVDKPFLDGRVPASSGLNSKGETGKVLGDNANSGGLGSGMQSGSGTMRPRGVVRSVMGKESSKGQ